MSVPIQKLDPCAELTFPRCDSTDLGECIDASVQALMKQLPELPGVMVSAQVGGETVYAQGFGAATLGGAAPTASTSFQIDSLTKVFTAFSVLRLYEEGKIPKLTDTLGTYMTELPNPAWAPIQIDQLLAMVSGIPDSGSATRPYTESLQGIAGEPLMFAPGSRYFYSNSNYFLLGELVDTLAGSFRKYARTKVLDEFGMPDTELIPFERAADPATPYLDGRAVAWRNPDCGYSGGGFASTMADLETFAAGLANGLVLLPATYRLMWTPYQLTTGRNGQFGLGWEVTLNGDGSLQQVQKNGGGWGWNSQVNFAPAGAFGGTPAISVCVLMNAAGCPGNLVADILGKVVAAHGGSAAPAA
jgi:D-alanyl-D-alanine carboxypeptidase